MSRDHGFSPCFSRVDIPAFHNLSSNSHIYPHITYVDRLSGLWVIHVRVLRWLRRAEVQWRQFGGIQLVVPACSQKH